jgi:hypothetical protein
MPLGVPSNKRRKHLLAESRSWSIISPMEADVSIRHLRAKVDLRRYAATTTPSNGKTAPAAQTRTWPEATVIAITVKASRMPQDFFGLAASRRDEISLPMRTTG